MAIYCVHASSNELLHLTTTEPARPETVMFVLAEPPGIQKLDKLLARIDCKQPYEKIKAATRKALAPHWKAAREHKAAPDLADITETFLQACDQVANAWNSGQERGVVVDCMESIESHQLDTETLLIVNADRCEHLFERNPAWRAFGRRTGRFDGVMVATHADMMRITPAATMRAYVVIVEDGGADLITRVRELFKNRCPIICTGPYQKSGKLRKRRKAA